MGYLKPATARASARFEADFLTTDDTAIEDTALEIALGADVNRQRIIQLLLSKRKHGANKKKRDAIKFFEAHSLTLSTPILARSSDHAMVPYDTG